MGATVILDTSVLSYLARGDSGANASFTSWLKAGNGIVLSRVSVYEFRRGVYSGSVNGNDDCARNPGATRSECCENC